jgi:hypothetical protein
MTAQRDKEIPNHTAKAARVLSIPDRRDRTETSRPQVRPSIERDRFIHTTRTMFV